MQRISGLVALLVLLAGFANANAAERTIVLKVANMYCASCPYIVKRSLVRVPGVIEVEVSLETKKARIVFDDAKTDVATLLDTTAAVGFPSEVAR